jgi:hypothetical protein
VVRFRARKYFLYSSIIVSYRHGDDERFSLSPRTIRLLSG